MFTGSAHTKEFKSKNGFVIELPKNHSVIEKEVTKLYEKNKDTLKDFDQDIIEEQIGFSKKYALFITDNAESPLLYSMTITVTDSFYNVNDVDKSWCPEFEAYFDQMITNKKVNLYICEKQILKINNKNQEVLKFKMDNSRPETLSYQYTLEVDNSHINLGGSCTENKCYALDQNLRGVVSSLKWNQN